MLIVLYKNGIKNITIYKSKFVVDEIVGYQTLFNISNGSQINVLESQFKTGKLTHFYISSGSYTFLTKKTTFRKGNFTVLSNQSDFMKDAMAAGITEIYFAKIFHIEVGQGTENIHSRNESNLVAILVPLFSVIFLCIIGISLGNIYRRRKMKVWKRIIEMEQRNRKYDALLCCNFDTDQKEAKNILENLKGKCQLKLLIQLRGSDPHSRTVDNIHKAVKSSNHAIVILSCGFLNDVLCMKELDLCLTKQLKDPSFKVVMILTEDVNTLLNTFSNKESQNPGLFARIRSHLSRYTYVQFNDPYLHEKLIKTINFTMQMTQLNKALLNALEILSKNSDADDASLNKFTEDSRYVTVYRLGTVNSKSFVGKDFL